ncbi:efflux RND transporter periplasmic adaptor subunit [bacterium]|nr:efflux RND transporter periplasmic adaptor subunit [bacterium]
MTRRLPIVLVAAAILGAALAALLPRRPDEIVLTGVVTTDDVIVGAEIQGRLQELAAREGDVVERGQLLARIRPREWKADVDFYADSERQSAAQVEEAEANLRFQEAQTSNATHQAEANLAAAQAQVAQAVADEENARLTFRRAEAMYRKGVEAAQAFDQARTAFAAATAHVEALGKQEQAAEAAVALAKGNADQVAARRATLEANRHRLAAAGAQREKAQVHLDDTEIRAPIDGIVDVRAARPGEVVAPGRAILTLIDPDDLWVRADVEETYIDAVRLGDRMTVRLPSGSERLCAVIHRGVDADFATQRDVSRTKRDIKTFEIRLRCDNAERDLAVGMTAYVVLPLAARPAAGEAAR